MFDRRLLIALVISLLTVACGSEPRAGTGTNTAQQANSQSNPNTNTESPLFRCVVKSVSLYPVPGNSGDLAISLVVTLQNSGGASVAESWTLEVNSPTPNVPSGLQPVHVNGVVELPGAASKRVDIGKEDLVLKIGDTPISKGTQIEGILTFVLPQTSERELSHNSSSVILHFKDRQGHPFQSSKVYIVSKRGTPS